MTSFEYYLAQFVDIHGRPKAKLVPAKHKDMIFTTGAGFAGFAIAGIARFGYLRLHSRHDGITRLAGPAEPGYDGRGFFLHGRIRMILQPGKHCGASHRRG